MTTPKATKTTTGSVVTAPVAVRPSWVGFDPPSCQWSRGAAALNSTRGCSGHSASVLPGLGMASYPSPWRKPNGNQGSSPLASLSPSSSPHPQGGLRTVAARPARAHADDHPLDDRRALAPPVGATVNSSTVSIFCVRFVQRRYRCAAHRLHATNALLQFRISW